MLQVTTLGNAFIAAGDLRVPPSSSRTFATLLYLASEPGRRVPRAGLQSLIFPDLTEAKGSHCLRQLVYKLRQSGAPIESRGGNVWIAPDQVRTDYSEIISSSRLTAEHLAAIEGGFLPGYTPEQNGAFAEWLDSYRTRATLELRRTVLRDLSRARTIADWTTVERAARACLALDPLNEEATLALAEAIAVCGSKAAAVRLLDDYLAEIGSASPDLRLPATVLRRRISERIPDRGYRSQHDLPFVGRDEEMAVLSERFQHARRGESQCVVISGEPGIGKTRLAAEFSNVAALDGARVERMAAQPHDVHRPLGAFIELVPRLLQLPGAVGCSPESMVALKRLTLPDPSGRTAASETPLDAESVFYSITRAISDLIDAIAAEMMLVLVVEDTHWLDPLSVRVIGDLVSLTSARRLLIVLTSRDSTPIAESIRHADCAITLQLSGISHDSAIALIARVVGGRAPEDVNVTVWMASVSCGNPLFIAAVTTHYLTTGQRFSVPPTLRSLLTKRLEMIDRPTFAVMQMCAVLGKYCTAPRLVSALDMPQVDLLQAVQQAQSARLVVLDDSSVTIAHSLIADAVIERSQPLALRVAHRSAARVLEDETAEKSTAAQLWELAEHWVFAAEYERALAAFEACSRHALDIGRPREAAVALNRALDLPLSSDTRARVGRELVLAAGKGWEYDLAFRGIQIWRGISSKVEHDAAEIAELRTKAILGEDSDSTIDRLLDCIGCREASSSHRIIAGTMTLMIAQTALRNDLADQARDLLTDLLRSHNQNAEIIEFSSVYEFAFGDLTRAAEAATAFLQIGANWSPAALARVQMNAARIHWHAGLVDDTIALLETAYFNSEKAGLFRLRSLAAVRIAGFLLDIDNGADHRAIRWFDRAGRIATECPDLPTSIDYISGFVQLALSRGDLAKVRSLRNATLSVPYQNRGEQRWRELLDLRIRQLSGDPALADVDLDLLVRWATRLPRTELADHVITVALETLIARGAMAQARQLLANYLAKLRQTRSPLDFSLRHTAAKLTEP